MLYKLAEGKTDRWKRVWIWERAVAEAVLVKPGRWVTHLAAAAILIMMLMNWYVVGQRLTPWAGFLSGAPYEITGLLMGITSIVAIAYTWYAGAHIRITFTREKCGPRGRAFLDAVAALTFMFWTGAMAWGTWWAANDALFRGKSTMVWGIPEAPFRFVFCFVALHFLLVLFRSFVGASLRAARPNGAEGETAIESEDWKAGKIIW